MRPGPLEEGGANSNQQAKSGPGHVGGPKRSSHRVTLATATCPESHACRSPFPQGEPSLSQERLLLPTHPLPGTATSS